MTRRAKLKYWMLRKIRKALIWIVDWEWMTHFYWDPDNPETPYSSVEEYELNNGVGVPGASYEIDLDRGIDLSTRTYRITIGGRVVGLDEEVKVERVK